MGALDSVPWIVIFYTLGVWSFLQALVAAVIVRSSIVLADLVPQLLVTVGALFVGLASATQYLSDEQRSVESSGSEADDAEGTTD